MELTQQSDRETYRAILLGQGGIELLPVLSRAELILFAEQIEEALSLRINSADTAGLGRSICRKSILQ